MEEFLPADTYDFCKLSLLLQHDIALPISGAAFDEVTGERTHKQAYLALREIVAAHIASGQEPILGECEKPLAARNWIPSRQTAQAFRDTGGRPIVNEDNGIVEFEFM